MFENYAENPAILVEFHFLIFKEILNPAYQAKQFY